MDLACRESGACGVGRERVLVACDPVDAGGRRDARAARGEVGVLEEQREVAEHGDDLLRDDGSGLACERVVGVERAHGGVEGRAGGVFADVGAGLGEGLVHGRLDDHPRHDAPGVDAGAHVVDVVADDDIDLSEAREVHREVLARRRGESLAHLGEPDLGAGDRRDRGLVGLEARRGDRSPEVRAHEVVVDPVCLGVPARVERFEAGEQPALAPGPRVDRGLGDIADRAQARSVPHGGVIRRGVPLVAREEGVVHECPERRVPVGRARGQVGRGGGGGTQGGEREDGQADGSHDRG